jgi:Protein of unknown function (DUF4231)
MSDPVTEPKDVIPSRADNTTRHRLDSQIEWYGSRSKRCQRFYKTIKIVEIVAAAVIPFLSALNISLGSASYGHAASWTIGGLGVLITILEGVLQLNQYQQNWIVYRSTCEALRHEKYLYLANAGSYKDAADPHALLAERIEALVSQEHAKWASIQQQAVKIKGAGEDGGQPKA